MNSLQKLEESSFMEEFINKLIQNNKIKEICKNDKITFSKKYKEDYIHDETLSFTWNREIVMERNKNIDNYRLEYEEQQKIIYGEIALKSAFVDIIMKIFYYNEIDASLIYDEAIKQKNNTLPLLGDNLKKVILFLTGRNEREVSIKTPNETGFEVIYCCINEKDAGTIFNNLSKKYSKININLYEKIWKERRKIFISKKYSPQNKPFDWETWRKSKNILKLYYKIN